MLFNSNTKQAIGVAESPINSTIFFPLFVVLKWQLFNINVYSNSSSLLFHFKHSLGTIPSM